MPSLCIITARGGSKRIPHKNVRDFLGKPIVAYSIEAALGAGVFDEVMVSTDDEAIARVARECGAQVPFLRSAETSGDYATTADVVREVVACYGERGRDFDTLCCLYPTAPFVTSAKLAQAYAMLAGDVDSVIPVVRFSFPPQRGLLLDPDAGVRYAYPEFANARSQDLPVMYHDCGQFYFVKTEAFLVEHSLLAGKTASIEVSETEVQDIDNLTDWELAEMKYERMVAREQA